MAPSILSSVDTALDAFFSGWNLYSTLLSIGVVAVLFWPLFFSAEPDIHPYLLARQSAASSVRQPGESAIYRSLETPHGYPLRSGLDVKDEGAPRWTSGRNGDLRDVWKEAVQSGSSSKSAASSGPSSSSNPGSAAQASSGKALAGSGKVIVMEGVRGSKTYNLTHLSEQINIVGKRIQIEGGDGARVAIYLANTAELLVGLFAAAFYGFTPILIPPTQQLPLPQILREQQADVLICGTRSLGAHHVPTAGSRLKHIIWVGENDRTSTEWAASWSSEWHALIAANSASASTDLPNTSFENGTPPGPILISPSSTPAHFESVQFTQANFTAAISAQLTALPRPLRFSPADTILPLVPLISSHTLTLVLTGLYAHSTIALYVGAAYDNDSDSGTFSNDAASPTVVLASSKTLFPLLFFPRPLSVLQKFQRWQRRRALAAGSMPFANAAPANPQTKSLYGARLIYVTSSAASPQGAPAQGVSSAEAPMSAEMQQSVRLKSGARVVSALTAPQVAGAVAQSSAFDYRTGPDVAGKNAPCGPPLSCVEVKLVENREGGLLIGDDAEAAEPRGNVVVAGPAVAGETVKLAVVGRFGEDGTVRIV